MQEQVELVQEQANDAMYTVTELGSNQEKMLREISWLRDYVVKLEFRIYVQEKQILDLKAHSLENNIIINELDEKQPEKNEERKFGKYIAKHFWKRTGIR